MPAGRPRTPAGVLSIDAERKWLEKHGLEISVKGQIVRAAAVLGPIIAGPLGAFLGTLGKFRPREGWRLAFAVAGRGPADVPSFTDP